MAACNLLGAEGLLSLLAGRNGATMAGKAGAGAGAELLIADGNTAAAVGCAAGAKVGAAACITAVATGCAVGWAAGAAACAASGSAIGA